MPDWQTLNASPYVEQVMADLHDWDAQRSRSKQSDLGMSQVGLCARQAQYVMEEGGKPGFSMAAIMGTAFHDVLYEARKHRPVSAEREVVLTHEGITVMGHPDEWDSQSVTDFKTSATETIDRYELDPDSVPRNYLWQVHLYAAALLARGEITQEYPLLRLVFFDRNGKREPLCLERKFSPDVLSEAINWLREVHGHIEAGTEADREKPVTYCQDYCAFFSVCREPYLSRETAAMLTGDAADHAEAYWHLAQEKRKTENAMKDLKAELRGVQGRTETGVTVRWTTFDRDAYTVKANTVERLDVRKK
jgi:hypothetical protein